MDVLKYINTYRSQVINDPNISVQDVLEHPDWDWNWVNFGHRFNWDVYLSLLYASLSIPQLKLKLPLWDRTLYEISHLMPWDIILATPAFWNWTLITRQKADIKFILSHMTSDTPKYLWDKPVMSRLKMTIRDIKFAVDKYRFDVFDWVELSANKHIPIEDIMKNAHYPWHFTYVKYRQTSSIIQYPYINWGFVDNGFMFEGINKKTNIPLFRSNMNMVVEYPFHQYDLTSFMKRKNMRMYPFINWKPPYYIDTLIPDIIDAPYIPWSWSGLSGAYSYNSLLDVCENLYLLIDPHKRSFAIGKTVLDFPRDAFQYQSREISNIVSEYLN